MRYSHAPSDITDITEELLTFRNTKPRYNKNVQIRVGMFLFFKRNLLMST